MDEVRQMLSRLAVEEPSSSGSGAADPKRALMVSLANAVLRQPAAPAAPAAGQQQQPQEAPSLLQQAAPLLDEWRQQQRQQERQQQQMGEALGRLEQQQERQQQQLAGALSRLEQQQERQQRQTAEALGRLEQRVAAVESMCHDMHSMLRQLVAQQQRTKQPMLAGVSGLGVIARLMVAATHGVLVQGDVALIEFIRTLDEAQAPADRFIIRGDLGDQALFIKERWLAFIQQKERAAAYRRFDSAFRAYLQNQAEGPFRYVMGQLTAEFQQLSQRVIGLEAALRQQGSADLAALLRTVQDNEREKLRLTLALHALKSAHAQRRFSWQHEEEAAGLAPGVADLLQGHLCGIGCAHGAPADEPTQAEYAAAVRESYQLMQGAITAINDALEEVREAQQDLLAQ
ncbi:hypothetical protein C2E21_3468 [Chlorella sorokiniana]|uniref:Uncharacterized protein n=1 Tax=Chlorella sorokiniana TaxID=3076 RepID=A0A2P6TV96_CHLSO|nr:hypothetical protein C2E21_3468 [Chlorella sorokiniana]|eukprot:PRW57989.1 hypothetical protein C2E21_3468 [Chlorella sorokiniana]